MPGGSVIVGFQRRRRTTTVRPVSGGSPTCPGVVGRSGMEARPAFPLDGASAEKRIGGVDPAKRTAGHEFAGRNRVLAAR